MTENKPQYNIRVENVLREHHRVLIDLARYGAEAPDVQRFVDDAVIRVSAALDIDHVKIMRCRPEHADLVTACWGAREVDSTVLRGLSEDTVTFLTAVAALLTLVIRRASQQDEYVKSPNMVGQEVHKREILLREMPRRVKNNFQTILAVLRLHMGNMPTLHGRGIGEIRRFHLSHVAGT
jgi:hypothetical protein